MERRLSEAVLKGHVESLIQLLEEDPLILDRTIVSCISETPLHAASMLGHLGFVKELLSRKPELAAELDSLGNSPLHLAVAKGSLEIVNEFLRLDPELCTVRNMDGRTALHLAAVKGRLEVLSELVRVKPESTGLVTDRGETSLHLCARHNRLEALKLLVEVMKEDSELLNLKDCDGNTVLHIAVARKQIEIIKFLVSIKAVEVNAVNANNLTALDIFVRSPRDLRDMEIEETLRGIGGLSAKDLHLITNYSVPSNLSQSLKCLSPKGMSLKKKPAVKHHHTDWLGRKRSALMVVASLIATVAFQAGLTPPGGIWQDDYRVDSNGNPVENPHTVGKSIMASKEPKEYGVFMIFNTIAFLASLSIILLLVSGLPLRQRRWTWIQMVAMWIAITAQVATFFLSLRHMSPQRENKVIHGTLREVTQISVLVWLTLMSVVFIGNVVRINLWVLRKYGYVKQKEGQHSAATAVADDDDQDEL